MFYIIDHYTTLICFFFAGLSILQTTCSLWITHNMHADPNIKPASNFLLVFKMLRASKFPLC